MALPADVLANVASFVCNEPAATAAAHCMRGAAATCVWTNALRRLWRSRGRYDTPHELIRHQVWVECRAPRNLPQAQPPRLGEFPLSRTNAWYHFQFLEGRAMAVLFHPRIRMRARFSHEGHPLLGVRRVCANLRTPTRRRVVLVACGRKACQKHRRAVFSLRVFGTT
eukprot:s836_g29.t1